MNATREQQLAMTTDRHLAVSASAGSGKTAVLVQRYVRLILSGIDVRHVVAITFTRKAAAEMLSRVAEEVEKKLAHEDNPTQMRKLKEVRERLTSARISTIHSFCSRLLREFPIEADVHPNFTEQAESDAAAMRRDCAEDAIRRYLENELTHSEAARAFAGLGQSALQSFVETILSDREKLHELRAYYSRSNEECLQFSESAAIGLIIPMLRQAAEAIGEVFNGIEVERYTDKQAEQVTASNSSCRRAQAMLIQPINRTVLGDILTLLSVESMPVFTSKGIVGKRIADNASPHIARLYPQTQEGFALIERLSEVVDESEADLAMIQIGRTVYGIAEVAAAAIEEQKRKSGELDFDDLQMKTLKLLEQEEVCRKIRKKIRYLMIDEFQDTNELQYKIAQRLVPALGSERHEPDSPNIYVVGDPKQSIYGFRGADVRVFGQTLTDIRRTNERAESAGALAPVFEINTDVKPDARELFGDVRITASFRLSPAIAAFVNMVCEVAMPQEHSGYEVGYDRMICARKTDRIESDAASVTMLIAHRRKEAQGQIKQEDTAESNRDETEPISAETDLAPTEAVMLARHIFSCVNGVNPLVITAGRDEQPRSAKYGDIAVLMRSRSKSNELAAALRREGVPFMVHSGSGFYNTQEIEDIRSYLSFLHNPDDDIALAATLRSPFFSVSDAGLLLLSHTEFTASLWENLQKYQPLADFPADYVLQRARRVLRELLPLAPRLTIPSLIRRLLELSGWHGVIAGRDRAPQMEANLEKIIGFARDFEHKGFKNLFDFVEELRALAAQEAAESEAAVLTTADVVNIMTIHAAKGLEFPVVALYNANSATSKGRGGIELSGEFGASFDAPATVEGFTVRQPSFLSEAAKISRNTAETAEEKRLLYVALTRAKDHFIISATVNFKKNNEEINAKQGFFKLIMQGTGLDNFALMTNHTSTLTNPEMPFLIGGEVVVKPCEIPFSVVVTNDDIIGSAAQPEIVRSRPILLTAPLPGFERDVIFSASQLLLFEQDATEYLLRYRLGMPDDGAFEITSPGFSATDEEDMIAGSFAGSVIHEALAELRVWHRSEQDLERLAREIIERKDRAVPRELLRRVLHECRSVAGTTLLNDYAGKIQEARFEYSLQLPIGQDFLLGTMDVLLTDAEGNAEIWDWKTNRVRNTRELEKLRDYYRRQMQVYSVIAAKIYPKQEQFTARLLFTRLAHAGAKNDIWTQTFMWSKAEILRFEGEIIGLMQQIKALS